MKREQAWRYRIMRDPDGRFWAQVRRDSLWSCWHTVQHVVQCGMAGDDNEKSYFNSFMEAESAACREIKRRRRERVWTVIVWEGCD